MGRRTGKIQKLSEIQLPGLCGSVVFSDKSSQITQALHTDPFVDFLENKHSINQVTLEAMANCVCNYAKSLK